jgi:hypothetical protein
VKVFDFGIAARVGVPDEDGFDEVIGTPTYWPRSGSSAARSRPRATCTPWDPAVRPPDVHVTLADAVRRRDDRRAPARRTGVVAGLTGHSAQCRRPVPPLPGPESGRPSDRRRGRWRADRRRDCPEESAPDRGPTGDPRRGVRLGDRRWALRVRPRPGRRTARAGGPTGRDLPVRRSRPGAAFSCAVDRVPVATAPRSHRLPVRFPRPTRQPTAAVQTFASAGGSVVAGCYGHLAYLLSWSRPGTTRSSGWCRDPRASRPPRSAAAGP